MLVTESQSQPFDQVQLENPRRQFFDPFGE
jgi:hypothetical protein